MKYVFEKKIVKETINNIYLFKENSDCDCSAHSNMCPHVDNTQCPLSK